MDTKTILMNDNCKFRYGEYEEAWYKGYDDSSWENVLIPHDFSVEAPFSQEYSSGTGYLRGGIAWYRIRVNIPEEYSGKRILLIFDGIYKNSMVWVNSYYMGKRPGGYSEICYDISDMASFGDDATIISVKVTHTDIADSRWFTGSGITRKVSLKIGEKVAPSLHGVFFKTDSIDGISKGTCKSALCTITNEIENADDVAHTVSVTNRLIDKRGSCVLSQSGNLSIDGKEKGTINLNGEIKDVYLWSVESPYLYRLETWISNDGGEYLTDVSYIGVRKTRFDPDMGFSLNGESMKLKGVCVHHDGGCLGAAMKKEVWRRRLELLKDVGCNAIRCSHNPHMPELYELCDEMGFLMMDEAFDEWENAKNKWSTGHNVYPPKHQGYYEDFPKWHKDDLEGMILRDRNHPSVILYSIGNEIDYPNDPYCHPKFFEMTGNNDNNKPAKERQFDGAKPNMERIAIIAARLVKIARNVDDTRPVTLAAAYPELSADIGFIDSIDVVGYNYKEHLYERDHKRFPQKTFLGSENSHSDEAWKAVMDNDYICGQFIWTGIDYLGEAAGWPIHGSGAGVITTAGFPKPEYEERARMWQGKGCRAYKYGTDGSSEYDGGIICNIRGNKDISFVVWKQDTDSINSDICTSDKEIGYLYQILVRGKTGTEVKVRVEGDGICAGIDNGDLSDNTPFGKNSRKIYDGNLVVYAKRTGNGPVTVTLECD